MRQPRLLLVLAAVAIALPAWATSDDRSPPLVQRFLARADAPLVVYRGHRRLHARNERFNLEGWLEVAVVLTDQPRLAFDVVGEGGSSYIRNKVLRRTLHGEQELVATGRTTGASLTADNYAFAAEAEGAAPDGSTRILLRPLRRDVLLVAGFMMLDAEADLLRVEGRLSKSPSFWTKDVRVVRRYGRIAGTRVPLSMESTAQVRIAGTSHMTITYAYEEINGVPVLPGETAGPRCRPSDTAESSAAGCSS